MTRVGAGWAPVVCVALCGCGVGVVSDEGRAEDAVESAAAVDAGLADAGASDGGAVGDGGTDASGPLDAGRPQVADAGASDAGPSSTRCPSWTTPQAQRGDSIGGDRWGTFAAAFFTMHCTRCHDAALTTLEARRSAPLSVNLDDEEGVRRSLTRVRYTVGVSHTMPYGAPLTCDERLRLVRWIDAAAPGL